MVRTTYPAGVDQQNGAQVNDYGTGLRTGRSHLLRHPSDYGQDVYWAGVVLHFVASSGSGRRERNRRSWAQCQLA